MRRPPRQIRRLWREVNKQRSLRGLATLTEDEWLRWSALMWEITPDLPPDALIRLAVADMSPTRWLMLGRAYNEVLADSSN